MDTNSQRVNGSQPRLRLGLCCQFIAQPICFRTTTATSALRVSKAERLAKLSELCLSNAESLLAAIQFCHAHEIGCFRINSQILPVKTHPQAGYQIEELPNAGKIVAAFRRCGAWAAEHRIRLVFHPDQFVVLNSLRDDVVSKSLEELEYHAQVAEWVGADAINIHAGGAFGDKHAALDRFARNVERLSEAARSRLTVENDDRTYAPTDLLPLCRAIGVPLVYDVHHHRCLPDSLSIEDATAAALETWNREPLFHISSPLNGWKGATPNRHHNYVRLGDFPDCWRNLPITVEVEAKAKERAIAKLKKDLQLVARKSRHATDALLMTTPTRQVHAS